MSHEESAGGQATGGRHPGWRSRAGPSPNSLEAAQLAGAPVGLGFLVALAYFGLIRPHLALPLVGEVAAEPSGGG